MTSIPWMSERHISRMWRLESFLCPCGLVGLRQQKDAVDDMLSELT
jgi:hypothetical protein